MIDVPSAARLRGLEKGLNLKGQEFATLLSILYVGWVRLYMTKTTYPS